ncbi:MAG: sigma 54-interacting transcriptional regulator [Desulfomonile tiedjei]|uniref:Sigma 54-interacting transcriptional regulator n=1 Tax=Desulfomonile tiedjei TaxID=2358 RepID=A0A9D6V0Q4_9BACT|nr:sigma 54-interacting transcriptional regulator [Desulfomonile tiedjei]
MKEDVDCSLDGLDDEVKSAQVHQIFTQARMGELGAILGSLIVTISLWHIAPFMTLVIWFSAYLALHAARLVLVSRFHEVSPAGKHALAWGAWFQAGAVAGMLFWGLAAVLIFPLESREHQFVLAVCVTGITTAAAVLFAPTWCFMPCVLAGMLPLSGRFIYEGGAVNFTIGAAVLLFTVVLVLLGNALHNMTEKALRREIERNRYVTLLNRDRERIEEANRALHDEIESHELTNKQLKSVIASRDQILERLEHSEQLHRMLVESARDIIWTVDLNLNYTYISPSVTEVLGYTVSEIRQLGPASILTRDSWERVSAIFYQELSLESRESRGKFVSRTEEIEHVRKNGTVLWTEITATFLRDFLGCPTGILGISRDISKRKAIEQELKQVHEHLELRVEERTVDLERVNEELLLSIERLKRTEKQLRSSEERFRAIFQSATDCMFIKDTDLRYSALNPAMCLALGIRETDAIGKLDEDVFGPSQNESVKLLDQRVLNGQSVESEHVVKIDEQYRLFRCSRVPLRDSTGEVNALCGIGRDITEEMPWRINQENLHDSIAASMRATMDQILQVAQTDATVLLLGESGSGKDYLARHLHDNSRRSAGPFFAINCAALPNELAESELFGHEAGAFTGAKARKLGLLEMAGGGTLLLNEIGELSLPIQAKLLTFLDEQAFTRVGGQASITVDVRILAATNRNLQKEVEESLFRSDLFYRINVFPIKIPSLRERTEDFPLLIESLLQRLSKKLGRADIPVLTPAAMQAVRSYHWPGNIRELKNVLERALILCNAKHITPNHLVIPDTRIPDASGEMSATFRITSGSSLKREMEKVKRDLIVEALSRSKGNVAAAARILGISRDVLRHQIKVLNLRGNY